MSKTLKNFINGELVDSRGKDTIDLVDPVTGKVYAQSPVSVEADIDSAYTAAAAAFEEWGETTPSERQKALWHIADAMEAKADEFAAAEVQDTGKPIGLTLSEEIAVGVDQIPVAHDVIAPSGPERSDKTPTASHVRKLPPQGAATRTGRGIAVTDSEPVR